MLRVRKKVLLGMRDDLQSKHVKVSTPGPDTDFGGPDMDNTRGWDRPFEQQALTAPHVQVDQGQGR
jgi:hypothetical protein